MNFDDAWVLWALPLALLPLWPQDGPRLASGWLAWAPRDRASTALGWLLRGLAVLALAALLFALAGPHRPEYTVERVGQGAEIVVVLDRSRSMDQGFAGKRPPPSAGGPMTPEKLDYYFSQSPARLRESKGQAARRLLTEFAARRPEDRFALVVFSTLPMPVLGFTQRQEAVQAAIEAGNIGRGLSETNIGLAIESALEQFEGRPYTGSRIVLLVSDGGDRLDPDMRERIAQGLRKQRAGLYWIYLRGANSPGLQREGDAALDDTIPETLLHAFFQGLDTPYRAYEASDSQALAQAIEDVDRLEKLPITVPELVPRRDLAPWAHGLALVAVLLLLAAQRLEIRRWA